MARFPFGIGAGWYPVAYSDELSRGDALRLRYFDTELLLLREDGAMLRDAAGRFWPVHEGAGLVSAWYHPDASPPSFALPDVPEWAHPAWAASYWKYRWTVRTHPQEMRENAIDWAHFRFVHGGSDLPPARSSDFTGARMTFALEGDGFTVRGEVWGLGWSVTRLEGPFEAVTLTALTPVDAGTTDVRSAFLVRRARADDRALRATIDAHARGIEQDIPIWENKAYLPSPILGPTDGPIAEFRRWAAQFYRSSP